MSEPDSRAELPISTARSFKTAGQLLRWWLSVPSLVLFILSLLLVKEGAHPLARFVRTGISVNNLMGALGLGWIAAILILSGPLVAANALPFMDSGVLNAIETFAMVSGSRLGASFIVLLIALIFMLRGRQGEGPIGAGLLSFPVTQTVYLPTLPLGF